MLQTARKIMTVTLTSIFILANSSYNVFANWHDNNAQQADSPEIQYVFISEDELKEMTSSTSISPMSSVYYTKVTNVGSEVWKEKKMGVHPEFIFIKPSNASGWFFSNSKSSYNVNIKFQYRDYSVTLSINKSASGAGSYYASTSPGKLAKPGYWVSGTVNYYRIDYYSTGSNMLYKSEYYASFIESAQGIYTILW